MSYENVLLERGAVSVLTVNRPEKMNALNRATLDEMSCAMDELEADESVRALVVTGAGEKSFVAGADVEELSLQTPISGKEFPRFGQALFARFERARFVTVAAVNGYALGGGCELALACHVRFASENARFGQPEVKLGIIPGYGGTQRLARLVPKGVAMEMVAGGGTIDAARALAVGLVNRVVPQDALMAEARAFAEQVARNAPLAVAWVIEAVNGGLSMPQSEGFALEADLFALTCATEDMHEGTRAFIEKRKAEFKGR